MHILFCIKILEWIYFFDKTTIPYYKLNYKKSAKCYVHNDFFWWMGILWFQCILYIKGTKTLHNYSWAELLSFDILLLLCELTNYTGTYNQNLPCENIDPIDNSIVTDVVDPVNYNSYGRASFVVQISMGSSARNMRAGLSCK